MLEIRDLVKHYQLGKAKPIRAIDGVTLTVEPGEFVALYGPSGSGKSTLIDLVAGAMPPDAGTVSIQRPRPGEDDRGRTRRVPARPS